MARLIGTAAPPRVVIDEVIPTIDGGRHAAKTTQGDRFTVSAHVFADGHDLTAVTLEWRACEGGAWTGVPMDALGNDVWEASFAPQTIGRHEYRIVAWVDHYGTWRADIERRIEAGWDVTPEILEGVDLVKQHLARATAAERPTLMALVLVLLDDGRSVRDRLDEAGHADALATIADSRDRAADSVGRELPLWVDRERARFSAWYEMFPRSETPDPARSATFAEASRRLPAIAAMGFDVLYLPPVHPIGRTGRKAPNNQPGATGADPGSPWAIGAAEGGHTAVHPELGTLADFDAFMAEAQRCGLEVALDLAFQCSPDHPWVTAHPDWFRRRADGSIRYAENPPKRYEDIYPFDFETADWWALWNALLGVVSFWTDRGVRIFRVDNPHTKPYPFWEWLIKEVHQTHPDVIFLAEAFTRPKRMVALAKLGFSQSYSYFTWRNTKAELSAYFEELTSRPLRDVMRPNLFTNTPDILSEYLQTGGRPAFIARLVLAATLGPNYGIYSGFELLEAQPATARSEEYRDSEKYQLRPRDWDAGAEMSDLIARLNRARRAHPALQFNHDLWFLPIQEDSLIAYMKADPEGEGHVLVVVNLDPHQEHEGWVGVPLAALGFTPESVFGMRDLLTGERETWLGEWHRIRLTPAMPARVYAVEGALPDEHPMGVRP